MKRALLAALALLVSLSLSPASAEEKSGKSKPNFIFILGEAHGWSATSVDMDGADPSHARPAGLTPNLERIAKEGMRFSEFYVSAPRCTPSRASFFTGISPAKLHMTYVNEGGKERRGSGEETSDASQRVVDQFHRRHLAGRHQAGLFDGGQVLECGVDRHGPTVSQRRGGTNGAAPPPCRRGILSVWRGCSAMAR